MNRYPCVGWFLELNDAALDFSLHGFTNLAGGIPGYNHRPWIHIRHQRIQDRLAHSANGIAEKWTFRDGYSGTPNSLPCCHVGNGSAIIIFGSRIESGFHAMNALGELGLSEELL